MRSSARRLIVDTEALRESRDLRLLVLGNFVSGLGTQAALVALPYQVYVLTGSAFLTGLLGAVELVPLVAMGMLGGELADRMDRRRLLLLDQIGLSATASALAAVSIAGSPPIPVLYLLAALLAGLGGVQNVTRAAIVPNVVPRRHLKSALAINFGLMQLTLVIGPAVAGLMIAAWGVESAYAVDAVSCLAMVAAVLPMSPQAPHGELHRLPLRRSIGEGLRFVRRTPPIRGTLAIDFMAMTFGMPRVLFPVLAVSVYGAGAAGTGLLHASVSAGAVLAALTTGWLTGARWLGRIVIAAVAVWGAAIAAAGLAESLWVAAALFALAGAADSVSAVCRNTINQSLTPDHVRGRTTAIFSLVATSGPRVGDVEAGAVAALAGVRTSVVSGGLACLAGVVVVAAAVPQLARYDAHEWLPERAAA